MPRTQARQYPRTRADLRGEPIVGMHDELDPNIARPNYAVALTNMYLPPGRPGRLALSRPGFTQMGAQLGGVGARTVQFLGQFTKLNSTRYTIGICGGKFYTYNWSTDTWTEAVNAATFSGASITLSTTARFYSAVLSDKIIFSDGANTPWMWDGTTNGGLTKLTNAPLFYGPICVYYSKLFGIKSAERDAFVWSEEGDPTIGYEAGGYLNAWSPSGASAFHALAASNTALYCFEARRAIRITGAVATDFQTSGTRSDIGERQGTLGPPLVTDDGVVFVSADGAPYVIRNGLNNAWEDCQTATATIDYNALAASMLVEWPTVDAVLIGVPMSPNSVISQWLVMRFSGDAPQYIGRWDLGTNDTAAVVLNDSLEPVFIFSGNADGYTYAMGQPNGSTWNDEYASGTVSVPHTVTWHPLGADVDTDRHYDRMTGILGGGTTQTEVTIRYQTSRGNSTPMDVSLTAPGGALLGLSFILGTSTLSLAQSEVRVVVGLNGDGRWIAPTWSHDQLDESFSIKQCAIESYPWGTDPAYP